MVTQALCVVVQTGLADHVGDEPVPVEALAGPAGIPALRLTLLLWALRTVGVFDHPRGRGAHRHLTPPAPRRGRHHGRRHWRRSRSRLPPWLALHMLVMLDGRERTEAQWRRLLAGHRWVVDSVRPGLVEALTGPR
jgi:hypothetical protein